MTPVLDKIKSYVLILDSTVSDDDLLTFMVADTVDRVLSYTNRYQLVSEFEEDLENYPQEQEVYEEFWENYDYPIPIELERPIARTVLQSLKTLTAQKSNEISNAIRSISDNGQSISYSDTLLSKMSNNDTQIFSEIKELLDKYKLATVIKNDNSGWLDRYYIECILRQDN